MDLVDQAQRCERVHVSNTEVWRQKIRELNDRYLSDKNMSSGEYLDLRKKIFNEVAQDEKKKA